MGHRGSRGCRSQLATEAGAALGIEQMHVGGLYRQGQGLAGLKVAYARKTHGQNLAAILTQAPAGSY